MRNAPYFRQGRRQHRLDHGDSGSINRQALVTSAIGVALLTLLGVFTSEQVPPIEQGLLAAPDGVGRGDAPQAEAYYQNCAAARAAGVAPLYIGEPGYRTKMDNDLDGVACERHRGR
ncbi:excalibur calcium-binding domain-containing protein [Sphingomonas sp. LY29]|uniref:excalibur calcium-binding domain-containing protein n=1 Tax=Sphingomonas sp. LY29 TaxID=3095341 RepID=UPI002D79BA52|nr:excalibur calcium-binding domain-containing protein [Sphingomonas sp. LY29]WRP25273.1 excalibur calcium-binding domain-containing protein [Sphingomonas sp. LY29]